MQGQLSEFTMAELLQLFALAERTGTLLVTTSAGSSRVLLESGRVVGIGAEDYNVHETLSGCELLPARSGAALDSINPTPMTPGLSFIVRNLVEPERWELFARRCVEQEVYPYLSEEQGSFEISVERIPICPLAVSLSVQQLVLDGSRWQSEMEEYEEDGFGLGTIFERRTEVSDRHTVSHVEWLVWSILDRPQSIASIARRIGIPDLEATSAVRKMANSGLVQRA
jgi:hypothetical protein